MKENIVNQKGKIMNEMLATTAKILANQTIDEICSKVYGRKNYVIALRDGKVFYYGTKGDFQRRYSLCLPLYIAVRRNYLYFTYKKDWISTLKKLGIEIENTK